MRRGRKEDGSDQSDGADVVNRVGKGNNSINIPPLTYSAGADFPQGGDVKGESDRKCAEIFP
ncbi:hypothetical protein RCZ04_09180 [Capnocytophaga sp. HP1101]